MEKQNRTQLILGILLILIGILFVVGRQIPLLRQLTDLRFDWPFYVVGAGALILVIGLLTGAPHMAIPASLVAGIGGVLYYQNQTQDWNSWAFLWTLIPGFVGIGYVLVALLGENIGQNLLRAVNLLVISAVLFLIFAAIFQRLNILGPYGPAALLILLGLYVVVRGLVRSSRPKGV